MFVIISSAPGSAESASKVAEAAAATSDLILQSEGVRHALKGNLEGFCGTAFAVEEDFERLGLEMSGLQKGVKILPRQEINRMLTRAGQGVIL